MTGSIDASSSLPYPLVAATPRPPQESVSVRLLAGILLGLVGGLIVVAYMVVLQFETDSYAPGTTVVEAYTGGLMLLWWVVFPLTVISGVASTAIAAAVTEAGRTRPVRRRIFVGTTTIAATTQALIGVITHPSVAGWMMVALLALAAAIIAALADRASLAGRA